MTDSNHYETLKVKPNATLAEIKQAYRVLVKLFHPDTNTQTTNNDKIIQINAAYEILGDPQKRQTYDRQFNQNYDIGKKGSQPSYSKSEKVTSRDPELHFEQWLKQVYNPVNQMLSKILNPLQEEIDQLAGDPFDDELMEAFQEYLETSRAFLKQAQRYFSSMPNPANVAGIAANLYYCLNQLGDGLDELELFTMNYDEHYLHTGQELFRIAHGLRREAHANLKFIQT